MKTVLITGAHGFIGRHCAEEFKRKGFRVIGIGHGQWDSAELNESGIESWFNADITFETLATIGQSIDIDIIVHCAGSGSVAYSFAEPMHDFQRTVDSTLAVLEFMRCAKKPTKLVYPSSAAIYGLKSNQPTKESRAAAPVSPYGVHKRIAEELCVSFAKNYHLDIAVIRFFSIYGAGLKKQLLWDACRKISEAVDGKVRFFGTGSETRDWLHVKDAAALIQVVSQHQQNRITFINGGSGISTPVRAVLQLLADNYGIKKEIVFNGEERTGDPLHYWADIAKATRLNWAPRIGIQDGIKDYVNWFKNLATNQTPRKP